MARLHDIAYRYYTINRILLLCVGLWPYQKSTSRHILITLMTIMLASSLVVQFTTFITTEYNVDILLHILAYSIPWLIYTLKYNALCFNIRKMKDLMDRVQCDWNELNNAQEVEIIKKYSAIGRYFTILCTLFLYITTFFAVFILLLSNFVLNEVIAVNDSHSPQLPILTEYFIDQQKYFIPILVHVFLFVLCAMNTVLATDTLYMSYTQHSCGLFEIASFRIEQALQKNMIQNITSPGEKKLLIRQKIISGIKIYRKAIDFVAQTAANYKWAFSIAVPFGVLSLSINLYRLSQLIINEEYYEVIISLVFVFGHFFYMFYANYLGQQIIDYSGNVFHSIYNSQWYIAPLETQKLLLFMMQRSMRHCRIVIGGGLYIPSFEGFATMVNVSFSYFMMIVSVR